MRSAQIRLNSTGRFALAVTVSAILCAALWLFGRSQSRVDLPHIFKPWVTSTINLGIYDLRGTGHEEVLAPILYSLAQMPHVTTTVFRQTYKAGFHELVAPYYKNHFFPGDDLLGLASDGNLTLSAFDVLILLTAEIDLQVILSHIRLEEYPRLRIISIVHRVSPWSLTPDSADGDWIDHAVLQLIKSHHHDSNTDQLCFMTLSPHMQRGISAVLRSERSVDHPCVGTFIPVMPLSKEFRSDRIQPQGINSAVIQGYLVRRWRSYDHVFNDLAWYVQTNPADWLHISREISEADRISMYKTAEPAFHLRLIGSRDPDGGPMEDIPDAIVSLTEIKEDLSYTEYDKCAHYYRALGESDALIPAFPDEHRYVTTVASSSMPAAVMARTPIVVSPAEAEAYSYLEDPAVVRCNYGESEIACIDRFRKNAIPVGGSDAQWQALEDKITRENHDTLNHLLNWHSR